jgi:hypothetical protein
MELFLCQYANNTQTNTTQVLLKVLSKSASTVESRYLKVHRTIVI